MSLLPDDIERMARFLGRDDPAIQRLVKVFVRNPGMRGTVRAIMKHRCIWQGFDPDQPPVFWPVKQLPRGPLQIGKVRQGATPGPPFELPESVLTQHVGIFGHNGTGKSYLAMYLAAQAMLAGYPVWVLDIEDEYSRLCGGSPCLGATAVEAERLRVNMFQPPGAGIRPADWMDELGLLLRGATFLRDGGLNIFRLGMNRLFQRKGIAEGADNWPSLREVIAYFEGIKFGPKSRSAGYLESLLNRLVTLADIFEHMAAVSASTMLPTLAGRSVIFRLHNLVGIPLQTLVGFLLLWLARYKEGTRDGRPHLVIIEEAHMLASDKSRQDIGENILSRMFRTARKRGISLLLCDQVPGKLPPAIQGNLACRIVMRLANPHCIWSVQNSMGLDRRQAETIATMEPRRAAVHYTLYPTPFEIEIPDITLPEKPGPLQLRQQADALIAQTEWTESQEAADQTPAGSKVLAPHDLAGDALLVMTRICEAPAEQIKERCELLRMDRSREIRARAELDERGLISELEQTIGGKVKFFRPTQKGVAWARKRHIRVKKFKSGIVHEYLLSQVEKAVGTSGPKWRLQRNSSIARDQGLQPDLLVMGPEGQRFILEVCCSNLDYDAKNILVEAEIPGIDVVIAVTPDGDTRRSLEQALTKNCQDSGKEWKDSVKLLEASQCLAKRFDWTNALAGGGNKT